MKLRDQNHTINRRRFLELTGYSVTGLVVGVSLGQGQAFATSDAGQNGQTFKPNAFIQIDSDSQVHFYLGYAEMGQGIYTGMASLIAEELDINPSDIQVHLADADIAFSNPFLGLQITGGSTSMTTNYLMLRQAAANTREAIREAASAQLNAPVDQIKLGDGQVAWKQTSAPYGAFVATAASRPVPEDAVLKPAAEFKVIGKNAPRLDGKAKSTGTAVFGLDVDFPGLLRAVVKRCPVEGGQVKSFEASTAETMPGVHQLVQVHSGIAVVADSYWQAQKAADQLKVEWEMPDWYKAGVGSKREDFAQTMNREAGTSVIQGGDNAEALKSARMTLDAEYWAPYLAHATMEPMNCTAHFQADRFDIWVPSQAQGLVKTIASQYSGIAEENVHVHATFLGGGFGRRAYPDFAAEAIQLATLIKKPIQLVYSREDDTRHDFYRPASLVRIKASVDQQGKISAWDVKRTGPSIIDHTKKETHYGSVLPVMPPVPFDFTSVEGLLQDYDLPNHEVTVIDHDPGLRVGFWRSVGHSCNAFFKESMIDELAHASERDELAFRLDNIEGNPRLRQVIEAVAERSEWSKTPPKNRYRGLAAHECFNTRVAEVAEVSVENGNITVHKITCAVDCGVAVNPDNIINQMESAIIYGISAALYGEIELVDGAVKQGNFNDYPVVRMAQSPEIDVIIIQSEEHPTGVGEPGLPPLAPAIANAVYKATGQRLRSLPLTLNT